MKIIGISGSVVGSKTRIAVSQILKQMSEAYEEVEIELIDLGDYQLVFSDGRDYHNYTGDTRTVLDKIMASDAYVIGTPIFQASIPGTLKNLFDLLPNEAFRDKVVGVVATAGSSKHYLVPEHQLKPILSYMKAVIIPKYVFVEERHYHQKEIIDDDTLFRLKGLGEDIVNGTDVIKRVRGTNNSAFPF